jgi:hypothetical protein
VGHHRLPIVEDAGQKLAFTANPYDRSPLKPLIQLPRTEVVSGSPGMRGPHHIERVAGHRIIQMASGDFNFGQFGHLLLHTEGGLPYPRSWR